ncbi:MAG: TonB family protein, partial [Gammaproteobacteria bacterium]
MMPSPLAHDRTDHASEQAVEILILSLDDTLITDVETSLEGAYRVHHARSDAMAVDLLTEHPIGVLVTDEAGVHPAFQKLTRQLRQQFPDLIIVGVGDRVAAPSLIDLVNGGQIYRFLLKPLSAGQVKLRVQSAARQHLNLREDETAQFPIQDVPVDRRVRPERPPPYETEPAPAVTGKGSRSRRPLIIGGALAAVVAAVVSAFLLKGGDEGRTTAPFTQSVPTAASEPAETTAEAPLSEVERALDAASVALQEERYIEPVEDNALDHYFAVLEIEPENPEAAAGLDTIAGVLLERAQAALSGGTPDDALEARTVVRGIRPDHPDMPLVDAQFAEYGRLLIARMNLAVAADDWTRAREQLDMAAQFLAQDSPEVTEARALLSARRDQFAINDRLALANERIASNSLTVPENDSAMFHLLALKTDFPENAAVIGGLDRLASIMFERTDSAVISDDFDDADRWLDEVDKLGVHTDALAQRREAVATARNDAAAAARAAAEAAKAEELALAAAAATALPETVAGAPDNEAAAGAGALVDTAPVEVSELEILRMVQPEYPRRAWVRDIEGWIDIEFTVTATGITRSIDVTGEQSPGWFDRAAIEAVEQWQF